MYDYLLTKAEIQSSVSDVNETVKQEIAKARCKVLTGDVRNMLV